MQSVERSSLTDGGSLQLMSFDGLRCTDDPEQLGECSHVLVYLNEETHSHPQRSAQLHAELDQMLDARRHLVLVHESRPDHGAIPFKMIIDQTPRHLVRDEHGAKRLYQELAVPLHASEHFDVSATLLLSALAGVEEGPPLDPWPARAWRWIWGRVLQACGRANAPPHNKSRRPSRLRSVAEQLQQLQQLRGTGAPPRRAPFASFLPPLHGFGTARPPARPSKVDIKDEVRV